VRYLLDTCVISEVVKSHPDEGVIQWLEAADEYSLFLSVLTLGEIQKGVAHLAEGKRRQQLQAWLDRDLHERFGPRLVGIDEDTALEWGLCQIWSELIHVIDALLAATARQHNLTLVTRNTSDFRPFSVHLFNPWAL